MSHIGNQSLCVGGWRDSWEHRDGAREENTVASEEGEEKWVGEQPLYPSALKLQWQRTLVDWQLGYPENNGALHVRQGTEKTAFPSLPRFICSKTEQYISMKFHRFPCHLSLFLSLSTYHPLSFPLTKITLGELREWSRVQYGRKREEENLKSVHSWTSLVVQGLRICLSMQGTQVRSLVRELRPCKLWGN